MKNFIGILLIVFTTVTHSQNGFKLVDNNLTWQKVFNDSIEAQELIKDLKTAKGFIFADPKENTYTFSKSFEPLGLKKHGYIKSKYPWYVASDGEAKGYIEFKEKRYRVTVTSIKIYAPFMVGLEVSDELKLENITYYVAKKDKIKTNKATTKVLALYDTFFNDLFTKDPVKTDDW